MPGQTLARADGDTDRWPEIFATQLSAITFVSTPALAYATDWMVLPGKAMILLMAPLVVLFYLPFFARLAISRGSKPW